jgi:hypothetical protein
MEAVFECDEVYSKPISKVGQGMCIHVFIFRVTYPGSPANQENHGQQGEDKDQENTHDVTRFLRELPFV